MMTKERIAELRRMIGGFYSQVSIERGLTECLDEIERLQDHNSRLQRDLIDPPADVQEAVIAKLNLVSGEGRIECRLVGADVDAGTINLEMPTGIKPSGLAIGQPVYIVNPCK